MKFHGSGTVNYPGTNRVVHDFEDGPFETDNELLIGHFKALGFSDAEPIVAPAEPVKQERKGKRK